MSKAYVKKILLYCRFYVNPDFRMKEYVLLKEYEKKIFY